MPTMDLDTKQIAVVREFVGDAATELLREEFDTKLDANRLFKPSVLAAAADFNTLIVEGRTVVPTNAIAAACTNRPSDRAGVLDVALIGGTGVFQTYRVFQFDLAYERQRLSNATWTDWVQAASKDMVDTTAANTLQGAKAYADANPLFKTQTLATGANLDILPSGNYIIPSDSVAATMTGLPPAFAVPRRGYVFVMREGTTNYMSITRDGYSNEGFERVGNGKSASNPDFAWLEYEPIIKGAQLTALDTSIKAWANTNANFNSRYLTTGEDLNELPAGVYFTSVAVTPTLLNYPYDLVKAGGTAGEGIVVCYCPLDKRSLYQKVIRYTEIAGYLPQVERVSNGGSFGGGGSGAWLPWRKCVSTQDIDDLKATVDTKPTLNLFPNPALTSAQTSLYQGTSSVVDGFNVLQLNAGSLSVAYYDIDINDTTMRVGDTLTVTIDGYTSETPNGFELALAYLNSSAALIGTLKRTFNTVINAWETVTSNTVVPAGAVKLQIRLLNRGAGASTKFRKPVLTSNAYAAKFITPSVSAGVTTVYVAKTGSDGNVGTSALPFLTISKAVATLPNGGNIVVLDSSDYRETVAVTSFGHVKISATAGNRVNIFGSDRLVVTKTAGFTKVYQAPLAAKPTGLGAPRGLPVIFEWGTKSKPIIESERHPLHRGLTHRLPYTEMFEAATKAGLDMVNGKWFWESGIIYFSATDGGDATLKRYEVRARPTLTHNNGTIELNRVSAWFSSAAGMRFNGLKTTRQGCTSYGSLRNGFDDNANLTLSHKDISGGNGNDGFNPTLDVALLVQSEFNTRLEQIYFDPYGHDNGDDGLSCHYRSDSTIYGGLFEYNTKADVVHVTGANCICYNTVSNKTRHGFYSATTPTGDTERVKTVFRCVSTVATGNEYSYTAYDDSVMQCIDTKANNPLTWGYLQSGAGALHATNAKYTGDALKAKSGAVTVTNDSVLT